MQKRAILLLAAFAAAMVIAIALIRWKSIVVRFHLLRLSGKPELQDAWLGRPADSIAGRAARTYFRERPDELVRKFLRTVRLVCERCQKDSGRPPPAALQDFEGQDRVEIHLSLEKTKTEGQLLPRMISFRFERKDREGGGR